MPVTIDAVIFAADIIISHVSYAAATFRHIFRFMIIFDAAPRSALILLRLFRLLLLFRHYFRDVVAAAFRVCCLILFAFDYA